VDLGIVAQIPDGLNGCFDVLGGFGAGVGVGCVRGAAGALGRRGMAAGCCTGTDASGGA
jgi:hypothetical protein